MSIQEDKKKLESEISNENGELLPGNLQNKKEMAEMYENIVDPEKREERKVKNKRKSFIKNVEFRAGL